MEEKEYLYMLSHVQGIGAVSLHRLKEQFGTFERVWKSGRKELEAAGFLKEKQIQALLERKQTESRMMKQYGELEKIGIRYLTYTEEGFPERLLPYKDCPAGLFVKGRLPSDRIPSAAIVGARNCTEYGRQTASWLASELASHGVQILSGLALGVDSHAHLGCLNAGGSTYAVLGCGVNVCYPKENYRLFMDVEQSGGIISEFVPGTGPSPMHFPMRNRIISGLSDAVIIVEARKKSGSLITGDLALDQGKEVFAVPGRIHDPLSMGCNRLLQMGAAVCLGPEDVLEALHVKTDKTKGENKNSEKSLAKHENLLYSFIDSRPKTLDDIVTHCQISVSDAVEILTELELKGLVLNCGNQYYCRKM